MKDKARILVVDDDDAVRLSYGAILPRAGCEAQLVPDGEEALKTMQGHPSQLVLLDLRMPGADGLSVLQALKDRWPETEVVVITGFPTLESAKQAMRLGAYDYLAKPVGPDEVINVANGAITQKKWAIRKDRTGQIQASGSGRNASSFTY